MVIDILKQESAREAPSKKESQHPKLDAPEENIILKKAFLRCYKKQKETDKDNMKKSAQIERLQREVEYLKMQNTILMNREYQNNNFEHDSHIY